MEVFSWFGNVMVKRIGVHASLTVTANVGTS